MLGLVAATQTACGDANQGSEGSGGAANDETGGEGGAKEGTDPTGSGSTGSTSDGGTGGALVEGSAGEGGIGGSTTVEGVTSSKVIVDLSLEEFTEMCDEAGGVVETHAHCGGVVTGKGFSYDSDTDVFTEHTCAGYNTCTGFSCVIED